MLARVAGGMMNKRGDFGSLAARSARSPVDTDAEPDDRLEQGRRRHCWVLDPDGSGPWPGLVAEWRRDGETWRARVVYAAGDSTRTVEQWLSADRLRPAAWPP